jgi:predicted GIY-YIG superfamily endonuclease
MNTNNADLKLPLIDLEADNTATGGKQEEYSVQPERLSEGDDKYCVYWIHTSNHTDKLSQGYVGITCNFKDRMKSHKKNKKKTILTDAIKSYGWNNLNKQILISNLSLKEALAIEEKYRPIQNLGWNLQKGGELGVEKEWYNIEENRIKHSVNTSKATKRGIKLKDTYEKRSLRAKISRINNINSYLDSNKGSKNPKAILNEEKVKIIKYKLIPEGLSNKEIAKMYDVKTYIIQFIRTGKTWKNVVCDSPAHE